MSNEDEKKHPIFERLVGRVASAFEGMAHQAVDAVEAAVGEGLDELKEKIRTETEAQSRCPACGASNTTHPASKPAVRICLQCGHKWNPGPVVTQVDPPG